MIQISAFATQKKLGSKKMYALERTDQIKCRKLHTNRSPLTTMPEPQDLSTLDIDSHVKAFTHITERLSNIEETNQKLLSTLRFNEMRKVGVLDASLFGYTFQLIREPQFVNHQARVEARLDNVIVSFRDGGNGSDIIVGKGEDDSANEAEVEEILQASIKKRESRFFVDVLWTDGYLTDICLSTNCEDHELPNIVEYVDEAVKLFRCIREGEDHYMTITVTPCWRTLTSYFHLFTRLEQSETEEERKKWESRLALTHSIFRKDLTRKTFMNNPYFEEWAGVMDSFWESLL